MKGLIERFWGNRRSGVFGKRCLLLIHAGEGEAKGRVTERITGLLPGASAQDFAVMAALRHGHSGGLFAASGTSHLSGC